MTKAISLNMKTNIGKMRNVWINESMTIAWNNIGFLNYQMISIFLRIAESRLRIVVLTGNHLRQKRNGDFFVYYHI